MMKSTILASAIMIATVISTQAQVFQWASSVGGSSFDYGNSIAVDAAGNSYTTGSFRDMADADPGSGTYTLTSAGGDDVFVSKLDAAGNFVWGKSFGGTDGDAGKGIALDTAGNVYATGYFQGTADFDPDSGIYELTSAGVYDVFVYKSDADGNLIWARSMGGLDNQVGTAVSVDAAGNVYLAGYFEGTADFDPGAGIYSMTSSGGFDAFVVKLDAAGNMIWAKSMGSTSYDYAYGMAVDAAGNVYVGGSFQGTVDFDPGIGIYNLTSAGGYDAFVCKLDGSGNLLWARGLGGTSYYDNGYSVAVDAAGNVYSTGSFYGSADFDPGAGVSNLTSAGGYDAFVSKLDDAGNFVWARNLGGIYSDAGNSIAVDDTGNVYAGGYYYGTADFDPGTGTYNLTSAGGYDVFVCKLDTSGNFVWAEGMGGISSDYGNSLAVSKSGSIFSTGNFYGTADFDPSSGSEDLTATGNNDAFVHRMNQCKSSAGVLSATACNSFTSPSGKYSWDSSGTYLDTIPNRAGCDSVITISLVIHNNTTSTLSATTCDQYTSPSGNHTWTASGMYEDTLINSIGCDSIISVNLTILNSSFTTIAPSSCGSYTSPSGNYTWVNSGTYLDTVANTLGCDSVITVNLTIHNATAGTIATSACGSYTSPSGNYTWNSSGTYLDTIANAYGCDSVITVNLTIHNATAGTIAPTVCDSYTSPSGNHTWYASGTYLDTIANAYGCDSVITVNLTIHNATAGTIAPTVCDSYTSPSGNHTWYASGTYLDTISNAYGCDSMITVNLTIHNATAGTIAPTVCDSYTSPSGNYTWFTSGTYIDTVANALGCDSVITVNLTVHNATASTIAPSACGSYSSPSGNHTWYASGTYLDTVANAYGCDSVITVNLTIHNATASTIAPTACGSYTSPSGNYTWNTSGTYLDTIASVFGCDSVITINLTISNATSSTIAPSACGSYTSPSGNYTWNTSGTYLDTVTSVYGCDSIITIILTIHNATASTIAPAACDSYTSPSGNHTWATSGTYVDTIANAYGCDSVITINLTIHNATASTIAPSACGSYTSPSGNYTWTSSGTYADTVANAFGCDSVITVNLTINTVDVTVTNNSPMLTANASGAVYQWLYCDSNYSMIPGATNQSYTASANGNYAVMVTQNGCTDTSACEAVMGLGVEENQFTTQIHAYPNPTSGQFMIDFTSNIPEVNMWVTNSLGQEVFSRQYRATNHIELNIEASQGIYFVTLQSAGQFAVIKVVKSE